MEQNTKQIRELTKEIRIGDRVIGGSYPILIQSMTNTKTQDVDATVEQILRLEDAGCEIIRCTVPDMEAVNPSQASQQVIFTTITMRTDSSHYSDFH